VCAADDLPADTVGPLLERLFAQSLVQTSRQVGTIRFALFEAVRRYAGELLRQSGEEISVRERHLSWCLSLSHRLASESLEHELLSRLEFDEGNIRSALAWTIDSSRADESSRLALGLARLWLLRGQGATGTLPSGSLVLENTASPALSRDACAKAAAQNTSCDPAEFPLAPERHSGTTVEVLTPVRNVHPVEVQPVVIRRVDSAIHASESPMANEADDALPRAVAPGGRGQRSTVLSERELSVAILVARGRSNREIAEELMISRKMADAHVSHILTKLGLWTRVQIATWTLLHCAGAAEV